MKKMALTLCALLLLFVFSAQAEETTLKDSYELWTSEMGLPEMIEVPEDLIIDYYGIDDTMYEDALFYTGLDNLVVNEVLIVKTGDEKSAEGVIEMFSVRLESWSASMRDYLPAQYQMLQKGRIMKKNDGIYLLLVTQNTDADAERMKAFGFEEIAWNY